jgi:aspartyl-tRNA(Asn)/glutamyl-tRNA(Gln) amidotransferase subunit A
MPLAGKTNVKLENDEYLTICTLAPLIRKRQLSPVELTEFCLARIEALQSRINAFITVTGELALKQAKQAEREIVHGGYRGLLHGIPVSLKDLFYTKGIRTTAGSKILRNFVPAANAVAVDRLYNAGAILIGKTNLHEFAYGATSINPHYGPVRNPWDPSRMAGGSSGGSAASVVAGFALASVGTDTGGSIRIPSAACGCVGLKPSYGRVPLDGVIPLAPSLDHAGPITRCVADAAVLLGVLAGTARPHPGRTAVPSLPSLRQLRKGIRGLRVGIPTRFFFDHVQGPIKQAVGKAIAELEGLGAAVRDISLVGLDETADLAGEITAGEALAYHSKWLVQRPEDYGSDVRSRLEAGRIQSSLTYLKAQERRRLYKGRLVEVLEKVDVLVSPTIPVVAPLIEDQIIRIGSSQEDVRLALLRLTRPGNLSGLPSVSVPCGFSSEGLPIGLQIMGREFDEATVLQAAYAYEQATPWHQRMPPTIDNVA